MDVDDLAILVVSSWRLDNLDSWSVRRTFPPSRLDVVGSIVADDGRRRGRLGSAQTQPPFDGPQQFTHGIVALGDLNLDRLQVVAVHGRTGSTVLVEEIAGHLSGVMMASIAEGLAG